jgi:hypothetical protein
LPDSGLGGEGGLLFRPVFGVAGASRTADLTTRFALLLNIIGYLVHSVSLEGLIEASFSNLMTVVE